MITAGAAESPVILHVPHASRAIPAGMGFSIGAAGLAEELDHLTDAHTDRIAAAAASLATLRPWIYANRWSRLVVDPERFPDDSEEMRAVGMGAVYTHGYAGRRLRFPDPVRDSELIASYFHPYAEGMASLVASRLAAVGRAVIVDVHSYSSVALPYELHRDGPRPQICLGTDAFHTPDWLVGGVFEGYSRELNSPFAGCYVPLTHYRRDPNVSAVMVEIRRDVYMREPGGEPNAGLDGVAAALAGLIDGVPS